MGNESHLRRLVVMVVLMLGGVVAVCQGKLATISRGRCPFDSGVIKKYEDMHLHGHRNVGETIVGKDSIVLAAKAGIVQASFDIGDVKAVMIRSGKFFYTYSNLDTVFVLTGQQIRAGEVIGICALKELEFVVSDSQGINFPPAKYLDCQVKIIKDP